MSTALPESPQVGDVYEDRDSRMSGRRIRILSAFEKLDPWKRTYPAFHVETIASTLAGTIGNKSSIGAHTILKRYRKVTETNTAEAVETSA